MKIFDSKRSLKIASFDKEKRTVEAVMSTETPVTVPDYDLMEMVDEILPMGGAEIPEQVPLLDTHDDSTITKQLGSTRSIRIEGEKMIGIRHFDNSPESDKALGLIEGGHLTDGSIRYRYENPIYVEPRKSIEIGTKKYQAGDRFLRIPMKWNLLEDSVCAIGADKNAKMRADFEAEIAKRKLNPGLSGQSFQGETKMETNLQKPIEGQDKTPQVDLEQVKLAAAEEAERKAKEHFGNVMTICRKFGIEDKADELIKLNADQVNGRVLQILEETRKPVANGGASVQMGADERDKFRSAAVDAMCSRHVSGFKKKDLAAGADQMRGITFTSLAAECLRRAGKNPAFMTREEILMQARALSTSDFTSILANVSKNSMMTGFQLAPTTWQVWCKKGSNPDFKSAKRSNISDAPDFLEVKEGGEVTFGKMSDLSENVALATYARKLRITRQAMINDNMGAFDSIFAAFGMKWASKVNALPYAVLSANAALSDTGALFNATAVTTTGGHANYTTPGGAPSSVTLSVGRQAMRTQKAPEGGMLNLQPAYLICGPANEDNALLILTSESMPVADMSSGVKNIYKNSAVAIVDANITGNEWYLACNPLICDTIEVAFLDGNEAPSIIETPDSDILGVTYTAYGDAVAKALSFRGLYKNAGQ